LHHLFETIKTLPIPNRRAFYLDNMSLCTALSFVCTLNIVATASDFKHLRLKSAFVVQSLEL